MGSARSTPVASPHGSPRGRTTVQNGSPMKTSSQDMKSQPSNTVSLLGVQGVGKSTVMKQFVGELGEPKISPEDSAIAKGDILRAVAVRMRFLLEHVIFNSPNSEEMELKCLENLYDDLSDVTAAATEDNDMKSKSTLIRLLQYIWTKELVVTANEDESLILKIQSSIPSGQSEQLFLSGGFFVKRLKEVMSESYQLTHDDWCHTRTWTRTFSDHHLQAPGIGKFVIRDNGGDELNRHQWDNALKESFCSIFVISLSDYTKVSKDGSVKFRTVREMLWNLADKDVPGRTGKPQFILLLNKQDLFRKMLAIKPMHEHCEIFKSKDGQRDDESADDYAERCEKYVIKYFTTMPPEMREKYSDETLAPMKPSINETYLTCATDQKMFTSVIKKLCRVVLGIMETETEKHGF